MFGPFWIARHAFRPRRRYRRCGSRQSSNSEVGGCAVALFLGVMFLVVFGAMNSTPANQFQAPQGVPAGPYGWVEDTSGHFQPAMAPVPVGVPFIPPWATPAPPPEPTTPWGLITLAAIVLILGGLAFIGWRMNPKPRTAAITAPHGSATYTCCGKPIGQPHGLNCRNWQPPQNPATWSNRR